MISATLNEFKKFFDFVELEDRVIITKVADCLKRYDVNLSIALPKMLENNKLIYLPYNCSGLFANCRGLTYLSLEYLSDTSNVTDTSNMFSGCEKLKILKLGKIDTSNVTDMSGMFEDSGLEKLDLTSFSTSNVTDMSFMFAGCDCLNELNVSSFNIEKVLDMANMFIECKEEIIPDWYKKSQQPKLKTSFFN